MENERYIILTGPVAISGTQLIIRKKRKEILSVYPERITDRILETDAAVLSDKAKSCILSGETIYSAPLGRGGFFKALWDMAKELKSGFRVDMYEVPVMQEIIEICEMFDVNPYITESEGIVLVVTGSPGAQIEMFRGSGLDAGIIGRLEKGNDKKLIIGDRVRFLDRPAPDETDKF